MQNLESIFDIEATQQAIEVMEALTERLLKELNQEAKGE